MNQNQGSLLPYISLMMAGMIMKMTLAHQPVSAQEVINLLISPGGIIVQIDSMASVGMDVRRESTGRGEDHLSSSRNRSRFPTRVQTVASTKWHIVRTVNNIYRSCELALRRQTSDSQKFTDSHGLFVVFCKLQKTGVEMGRVEEEIYIAADVRTLQVPSRVVRVFAVEPGLLEVGAAEEHWHIVGACRIPGEHERIGKLWIHRG